MSLCTGAAIVPDSKTSTALSSRSSAGRGCGQAVLPKEIVADQTGQERRVRVGGQREGQGVPLSRRHEPGPWPFIAFFVLQQTPVAAPNHRAFGPPGADLMRIDWNDSSLGIAGRAVNVPTGAARVLPCNHHTRRLNLFFQ